MNSSGASSIVNLSGKSSAKSPLLGDQLPAALNDTGEDNYHSNFRVNASRGQTGQRVELILVEISRQPFGLLISQVYNIVRPQAGQIQVLRQPDPIGNRLWGEIAYLDSPLRVLEMARMLHLPPAEPIERSRILLTGQLLPNGSIREPYGLAVDDILAVQLISLNDLRLIPRWVSHKRLGGLIWGVALLDPASLSQQHSIKDFASHNNPAPLERDEIQDAPGGRESLQARRSSDAYRLMTLDSAGTMSATGSHLTNPAQKVTASEPLRPVILLDVSQLKNLVYNA